MQFFLTNGWAWFKSIAARTYNFYGVIIRVDICFHVYNVYVNLKEGELYTIIIRYSWFFLSRDALAMTMIELIGITIAANSGVTLAIMANGTIKAL